MWTLKIPLLCKEWVRAAIPAEWQARDPVKFSCWNTGYIILEKRIIELAHWLEIVRGQKLNKIRYPGVNRVYKPASTLNAFAKLGGPEPWILWIYTVSSGPVQSRESSKECFPSPFLCPHLKLISQMATLSSKRKLEINYPSHHQLPHQGSVREIALLKLWSWVSNGN